MDEKRTPLIEEESKYKKKSQSKGQPRSKHKHIYETVLLHKLYHSINYQTGKELSRVYLYPTKVCTICGRVGDIDKDSSYYIDNQKIYWFLSEKSLTDKALSLPKWYVKDYFDKFAIKMKEE